jgi:hypothetical protein
MSKVMLVGLVSGEQIVGKMDDIWSDSELLLWVNIKNPAILVGGEKGLGMAPWLLYTNAEKEGVMLKASNIVFAAEPRIEIVNQYNAQYGNGLVLPTKEVAAPELSLTTE